MEMNTFHYEKPRQIIDEITSFNSGQTEEKKEIAKPQPPAVISKNLVREVTNWRSLALCSSPSARNEIPMQLAKELLILPLASHNNNEQKELLLAISDDGNEFDLLSQLKLVTSSKITFSKVEKGVLEKAIISAYKGEELQKTIETSDSLDTNQANISSQKRIKINLGEEASSDIPRLLQGILNLALQKNASDIHLESIGEDKTRLIFRVDGRIKRQENFNLSSQSYDRLIRHIKIISGLDITEHFSPQDGMFEFTIGGQSIRVRISILPNLYGAKLAARLLYHPLLDEISSQNKDPLYSLGLSNHQEQMFTRALKKKGGLILLSGPTGSGKSTLLYGLVAEAAKDEKNIISIEDPVERNMSSITQIEVSERDKMSYNQIFKSLLRQDPDMIVVSEIRDAEAAQTAIQATLSGSIVLSTIHASNVIELILRLFEFGCSPVSLGSCLKITSSQRLLPRNCPSCLVPVDAPEELKTALIIPENIELFTSKGCHECHGTKIKGRIAVYESCEPSLALISELSLIYKSGMKGASGEDLREYLVQSGYTPFSNAVRQSLLKGELSPETASSLHF